MSKKLSDVHQIADDLLRMGEFQNPLPVNSGKLLRVPRQEAPSMPNAALAALEAEVQKLGSSIEAIRKSVELTEAHVLLRAEQSKPDVAAAVTTGKGRWLVALLIATNLVTALVLVNAVYGGQWLEVVIDYGLSLKASADAWLNVKT